MVLYGLCRDGGGINRRFLWLVDIWRIVRDSHSTLGCSCGGGSAMAVWEGSREDGEELGLLFSILIRLKPVKQVVLDFIKRLSHAQLDEHILQHFLAIHQLNDMLRQGYSFCLRKPRLRF